jgi:hypothetical protein
MEAERERARGAMYAGTDDGSTRRGTVDVNGGSLAFWTHPLDGSTTRGKSSYG